MDITFGICSSADNKHFHQIIVDSIRKQEIPNYEIIFVGEDCFVEDVSFVYEKDTQPAWITKKKNNITNFARYENIVYMHDYIQLDDNWYKNFLAYGDDFQVCMNSIENLDGQRAIDWLVYYQDVTFPNAEQLLPYDKEFSKVMYIPGFYWVAKKSLMEEFPLNESLKWGEAEDIEWSRRVRSKYNFSMNEKSVVKFLKQKDYKLNVISPEHINKLEEYYNAHFK